MKSKTPLVLLAGRTNVGKSALFNRIIGSKKSLVLDREGVTRDWIEEEVKWSGSTFRLADIGGLENGGLIEDLIREAFSSKVREAKVVVMVCDIITGPTSKDVEIAKMLKQQGKTVILATNKCDDELKDLDIYNFMQLGLGTPMPISALHARGVTELLEEIIAKLPERPEEEAGEFEQVCKISIVGKPNTGKSSLLNRMLGKQRSIVSDQEGTTRESIADKFFINDTAFQVTDTAGVRRRRSVNDELEIMMVKNSMEAIRRSNLAVLVIDGSQAKICSQELKILSYALEQKKAVILAINKSDLIDADIDGFLQHSLEEYPQLTRKFPVIKMSCKENKNIGKLKNLMTAIWKRCLNKFDEDFVDDLVKTHMTKRPIHKQGQIIKVSRIRPVPGTIPTFHVKVNKPQLFDPSHQSYIENILRSKLDLFGCPIRFSVF